MELLLRKFTTVVEKKEQKQEIIKDRNGWMETLADQVYGQGEHILQHYYISHNHPYKLVVSLLLM